MIIVLFYPPVSAVGRANVGLSKSEHYRLSEKSRLDLCVEGISLKFIEADCWTLSYDI